MGGTSVLHGAGRFATFLAMLVLAGCVDTTSEFRSAGTSGQAAIAKASLGSPRGAAVALASIDGAPAAVTARFSALFASAAAQRDMTIADAQKANYLVRGYLTAYPVENGTAIGYVWDVFDASRHRTQRVNDAIIVHSSDTDAWQLASDGVLDSLAAKSAEDLVQFLAGTPEAIAVARAAPAAVPAPLAYGPGQ